MRIAITLLTCNGLTWTRECIRTLLKYTPGDAYDLIICDDGSTDGTLEYIRSLKAIIIENPTNMGVAKARNNTIRYAVEKGIYSHVCFIHNDMLFTPKWFESSLNVLSSLLHGSTLGIANIMGTDSITFTDDQRAAIAAKAISNKISFANLEPRFYPVALFPHIGYLDETYKQSECEDVDFNIRINRAGYNITATNAAAVFHYLGMVRLKLPDNFKIRNQNKNTCLLKYGKEVFDKWNKAVKVAFMADGRPWTRYGC